MLQHNLNVTTSGGMGSHILILLMISHLQLFRRTYGNMTSDLGSVLVTFFHRYGSFKFARHGISLEGNGSIFELQGTCGGVHIQDPVSKDIVGQNITQIAKIQKSFIWAHRKLSEAMNTYGERTDATWFLGDIVDLSSRLFNRNEQPPLRVSSWLNVARSNGIADYMDWGKHRRYMRASARTEGRMTKGRKIPRQQASAPWRSFEQQADCLEQCASSSYSHEGIRYSSRDSLSQYARRDENVQINLCRLRRRARCINAQVFTKHTEVWYRLHFAIKYSPEHAFFTNVRALLLVEAGLESDKYSRHLRHNARAYFARRSNIDTPQDLRYQASLYNKYQTKYRLAIVVKSVPSVHKYQREL